jgi:predicted TIM-barrel fold metal-dependent hydrolase
MIIDCHCHAGKGDGLTGPWNTDAPLGRYFARARAAGIGAVNFLPAFHTDYGQANRGLARLMAHARPGLQMFAFAFVHAKRDAGRVLDVVRTAVQQYGFIGIKCHRHDARLTREICEAGRTLGVPILYDVTGEIAPIELYAREYRDVAFIIPHLGSFVDDWAAQLQLIDHLTRHPNVFTDTAGVRRFDLLVEAVRRAGPGKVLFGSDGPYLHPGIELAKIRALGLRPEHERAILGGNFLKLTRAARVRQKRIAA